MIQDIDSATKRRHDVLFPNEASFYLGRAPKTLVRPAARF